MKTILAIAAIACLAACAPRHLPDDPTSEPPADYSHPSDVALKFHEPGYSETEAAYVLTQYPQFEGVPADLKKKALLYYNANKDEITNHRYIGVVDFANTSRLPRFYILNLANSKVQSYHVAHGTGSDPDNTGYAESFSNVPGSRQSSLGAYLTAEKYQGHSGPARRLDGLSDSNSNVRARDIVLHGANYVTESNKVHPGRSWGCLAISMRVRSTVLSELSDGSLIYAGLSNE
jgi:hypothetical protein